MVRKAEGGRRASGGRAAAGGGGAPTASAAAGDTAAAASPDDNGGATGLFRAVLSWDFGAVVARLGVGKGVIDGDLAHVPKTFASTEVKRRGTPMPWGVATRPPAPSISLSSPSLSHSINRPTCPRLSPSC